MITQSLTILGSTGSIGTQALEVCKELGIKVNGISANQNISLIENQIREFKPAFCHIIDLDKAKDLKIRVKDTDTKILCGKDMLSEFAVSGDADTILTAVVGAIGAYPTLAAIDKGLKIALANKETLVAMGELVTKRANEKNATIIPVDSEHSAIFQSICGNNKDEIKRLILTASGGPFYGMSKKELEKVTLEDALKHPNWTMGQKITIDSATLMNKGLEVIEARWLFGVEAIDVVVHRQSIIHSMVEYVDNSIIAQMGAPSMKLPIQYALTYPNRLKCEVASVDFKTLKSLTFDEPDLDSFTCLKLAYDAVKTGGTMPLVLNAANEIAVLQFLNGKIKFLDIATVNSEVVSRHKCVFNYSLDDCAENDLWARQEAKQVIEKMRR